jgi:hypothetical protein
MAEGVYDDVPPPRNDAPPPSYAVPPPVEPASFVPSVQPRPAQPRAARTAARRVNASAATMLALLALTVGVLAGGVVAAYGASRPATFRSSAVLLVDQPGPVFESGDESLLGKLYRLRFKYVGLMSTLALATAVADDTGLPVSLVHRGLSAQAPGNTLLLDVTAQMPTARQAQLVAESGAEQLVAYVQNEQLDSGVATSEQVTLSVVTPAPLGVQVVPDKKKVALEGAVVFAVITVLGALGADLLRRRA